tara:strand:+ start:143 stop:514 length:372 start_codon:yes stop_codon:yes gene_type:complete
MKIIDTLKNWVDVELGLAKINKQKLSNHEKYIVKWYFFGSCDVCCQAMELEDKEFLTLFRETLRYTNLPDEEIEEVVGIWMLDKIANDELAIINKGAHSFGFFKKQPEGVGGLGYCISTFKNA